MCWVHWECWECWVLSLRGRSVATATLYGSPLSWTPHGPSAPPRRGAVTAVRKRSRASWPSSSGEREERRRKRRTSVTAQAVESETEVKGGLSHVVVAWDDVSDVVAQFDGFFAKSWKWCCCMMGRMMTD